MVKAQPQQSNKNKVHKTLRDKLRKRRQEMKRNKKQKSEHRKQYDSVNSKQLFFTQGSSKSKDSQIRIPKLQKHIESFINIYQDSLEQFFDLFKTFDQSGFIDISGLQNKQVQKVLKKIFKYLPLQRSKKQYRKNENAREKLEDVMRNVVAKAIEDYLENGTDKEEQPDSSGEEKQDTERKQKKKIVKVEEEMEVPAQIRLYKHQIVQPVEQFGPTISEAERQQLAKLFEEQLKDLEKQKQQQKAAKMAQEDNEFSRIFSQAKSKKQATIVQRQQSLPEHLLAEGSAQLNQRVQIDEEEINAYNRQFRSRKLIDQHREIMRERKGQDEGKRKPFDHQRDIANGRQGQLMSNSTFFDFRNRMTKPKATNSFL